MIVIPPLPGVSDLAALLGRTVPGDAEVSKSWRREGDDVVLLGRSAWALQAIVRWWMAGHGGRRPRVWLPAYFCNQSTEPVRRMNPEVFFFDVNLNLQPDWAFCDALAKENAPDLFVLTHYFGRASDALAAREFCRAHGAMLIEDCAHVLRPQPGIGEFGDFAFYSPHKLLATPDGSILVRRGGDNRQREDLRAIVAGMGRGTVGLTPWLAKRSLQAWAPAALLPTPTRNMPDRFDIDPAAAPMMDEPQISKAGRKLIARASVSLDKIACKRRENARILSAAIVEYGAWSPVFGTDETDAPYRLVMRCPDREIAHCRYERFRSVGLPIETWPDLPPEVRAQASRFPGALALRNALLAFPIHQSLRIEELIAAAGSALAGIDGLR